MDAKGLIRGGLLYTLGLILVGVHEWGDSLVTQFVLYSAGFALLCGGAVDLTVEIGAGVVDAWKEFRKDI